MTRILLDNIEKEAISPDCSKTIVELGAATMLPCLVIASKFPNYHCFATDLNKIMPLVEQCHALNDSPSNIEPLELLWGNRDHFSNLEERL